MLFGSAATAPLASSKHGANEKGQTLPAVIGTQMLLLLPPDCLHAPAVPSKHPAHVVIEAAGGGGGGGGVAEHGANVEGQTLPAAIGTQIALSAAVCMQPPAVPAKQPSHIMPTVPTVPTGGDGGGGGGERAVVAMAL